MRNIVFGVSMKHKSIIISQQEQSIDFLVEVKKKFFCSTCLYTQNDMTKRGAQSKRCSNIIVVAATSDSSVPSFCLPKIKQEISQ
jgi:hypothetical protein